MENARARRRDASSSLGTERLLTTEEAAARLGVHARTIRRAIAGGALPAIRRGRSYLIPASALSAAAGSPAIAFARPEAAPLAARPEPAWMSAASGGESPAAWGVEPLAGASEERGGRADNAEAMLRLARDEGMPALLAASPEPLARLQAEHVNLHAALCWLAEAGHDAELAQLAAALPGYWYASSHLREGRRWLEQSLARSAAVSPLARARLQAGAGRLAACQGEHDTAASHFAVSLPLLRAGAAPLELAAALIWCGALANHRGVYTTAEAHLWEALHVAAAVDDPRWAAATMGIAHNNLGVTARSRGDLAHARVHHETALAQFAAHGHELGMTRSIQDLADVARDQGDLRQATARYYQVLRRSGGNGDLRLVAEAQAGIACAGAAWGKARPATRLLGATTALRARLGTAALVAADVAAEGEARTLVCRALGAAQVAALEAAAHRHSFSQLEDDLQEILAGEVTPIAAARADRVLTPRERDVLARLVTRRTNREIAAALFLSPATVAWHIGAILDKLDVASRHEAAARAVADGWLEQPW